MTIRSFLYRRDFRPAVPEGLGEHVDREFEKIENALEAHLVDFSILTNAVNDAAAATAGVEIGKLYRNGSIVMVRVT